ncbi:MAG: hypothetical protein IPI23_19290 [Bacteroidetes bacterium]|nr:hypothetical protein [Bacteroidota bacterium]
MILLCETANTHTDPSSVLTTYLPLVSPIVVILLFLVDRVIGFYLRKREIERNWYLKVLIEPGISKISAFYKATNDMYAKSAELLQNSSTVAHEKYLTLKSHEIGKFQSHKRELEAEVIFPILMRYPEVGDHLTSTLLNLEDCFTTALDKGLYSEQEIKDFQNKVASNRALLLTNLYAPLQSKFLSNIK